MLFAPGGKGGEKKGGPPLFSGRGHLPGNRNRSGPLGRKGKKMRRGKETATSLTSSHFWEEKREKGKKRKPRERR